MSRRKLRERVADLGFLLLLVFAVLTAYAALRFHAERMELERLDTQKDFLRHDLQDVIGHMDQTLLAVDVTLQSLLDLGHDGFSLTQWESRLTDALRFAPYLRSLSLLDNRGMVIASSNPANLGVVLDRSHYLPPGADSGNWLRVGAFHVGRDLVGARPGSAPTTAPLPGREEDTPVGFFPVSRGLAQGVVGTLSVVATLNPDYFFNRLMLRNLHQKYSVSVLRYDGELLLPAWPQAHRELAAANAALVARWLQGAEFGLEDQPLLGEPHAVAWGLSTRLPIGVALRASHAQAVAVARDEFRQFFWVFMPLTTLGAVLVLFAYFAFRRSARKERKQREEEAELLATVLDAQPTAILLIQRSGAVEFVNQTWRDFRLQQGIEPLLPAAPRTLTEIAEGMQRLQQTPAAESGAASASPSTPDLGPACLRMVEQLFADAAQEEGQNAAQNATQLTPQTAAPPSTHETLLQTSRGPCWISSTVRPCRLHGELAALLVIADITERKQAQLELHASEQRYRETLQAVNDGMWEWDLVSGEAVWDDRCYTMLGYAPQEFPMNLRFTHELLHPEDAACFADLSSLVAREGGFNLEFRLRCADGRYRWIQGRGRVVSAPGVAPRARGTHSDIQDRRELESRTRLLAAALSAADNAIVITNTEAEVEWANPAFTRLTGYSMEEAMGQRPGDLVRSGLHEKAFYTELWQTILAKGVWRGELINRRRDGSLYHEAMTITPVLEEHGEITHFVAIKENISARKAAQAALDIATAHLSAVVQHMEGGVLFEDMAGRVLIHNATLVQLFHLDAMELRAAHDGNLVGLRSADLFEYIGGLTEDAWIFQRRVDNLLHGNTRVSGEEITLSDGRVMAREFVPIEVDAQRIGFLWIFRDISHYKRREHTLFVEATTDPLTGVSNRRAFVEHLRLECARQRRTLTSGAVLMFDLDHFKQVNDTHGHAAGDEVLRYFSRLVTDSLRVSDVFGRLGGEEFAALIVDAPLNVVREIAERIRSALAAQPVLVDGVSIPVTVSTGVALLGLPRQRGGVETPESLLARADEALYVAKERGRNRVEGIDPLRSIPAGEAKPA